MRASGTDSGHLGAAGTGSLRHRDWRLGRWWDIETQGSKEVRAIVIAGICTSCTIVGKFCNNVRLQGSKQLLPSAFSTMLPQDCLAEGLRSTVSRPRKKKTSDHQIPVELLP